jgi:hypothetical protein
VKARQRTAPWHRPDEQAVLLAARAESSHETSHPWSTNRPRLIDQRPDAVNHTASHTAVYVASNPITTANPDSSRRPTDGSQHIAIPAAYAGHAHEQRRAVVVQLAPGSRG